MTLYLPTELIEKIVELCSLQDCVKATYALAPHLSYPEKQRIVSRRCDIKRYLKQLVDDPMTLLHVMMCTKTIISGSRALEYFEPGLIEHKSDWDFFLPNSGYSIMTILSYLRSVGTLYLPDRRTHSELDDAENEYESTVIYGVLRRGSKVHRINIVFASNLVPASCSVIRFHSSIVQCFIAGFGAVSLYNHSTSEKRSLQWGRLRPLGSVTSRSTLTAIYKYRTRGVKYITYEEYYNRYPAATSSNTTVLPHRTLLHYEQRNASDTNSYKVCFAKLFTEDYLVSVARTCFRMLGSIAWIERLYTLEWDSMRTTVEESNRARIDTSYVTPIQYASYLQFDRRTQSSFRQEFSCINERSYESLGMSLSFADYYPC